MGVAAAALCALTLHACVPAQELPEAGLARILNAVGISEVAFQGREYEPEAVRLTSVKGRVSLAKGYLLTAPEVRATRVDKTKTVGWQTDSLSLNGVVLATADDPDRPRATFGELVFDPVRTETTGTAWRGVRASRVSFLDEDGNPDLTLDRLVMRWNPIGGDGTLRLTMAAENVQGRPSWIAGLGAGSCLVGALTVSGPLTLQMALNYRPADGTVTVENASLSGRGGAVGLTLSLDAVPAEFVTPGRILATLIDPDTLPDLIQFKGVALDYRDAGAAGACFAAVPAWDSGDAMKTVDAIAALPVLTEERDRTGFARALASFAAEPYRIQLWLNPVEALALRYLPSALTSPARNRYLTTTLAVNDGTPFASLPADASSSAGETAAGAEPATGASAGAGEPAR